MRKVLLSVMMVSSLLAFNACKKGDQGPIGPAGPTGAAGAVGATGVKGADGTKILTGAAAPTAAQGADGDFYFATGTKTLYGPKAAGAWPAGTSLAGSNGVTGATGATGAPGAPGTPGGAGAPGATGATGAAGSQFLAGPGAPTAGTGNVGDYYFDTTNSIFYGPKAATAPQWSANVIPMGTTHGAKTFYLTVGLSNVQPVAGTRANGQKNAFEWGALELGSSYFLNADDQFRISKYPGWGTNREMIFQTNPTTAPGVYDDIPQSATDLGPSTQQIEQFGLLAPQGLAHMRVGAKFRYTQNFTNPTQEFTLTQADIDRLKEDNGNSFYYLTYAKVNKDLNLNTAPVGTRLEFHRTKKVMITDMTDAEANTAGNFHASYTAETNLNLNSIAGLGSLMERYKQDGKVFMKYKYVDPISGNPRFETGAGAIAGWYDATTYLNSYTVAGGTYGPNYGYPTVTMPAYSGATAGGVQGWPFGGANLVGATAPFGTVPAYTIATNQEITGTGGINRSGVFKVTWAIRTGNNWTNTTTPVPYGPITLVNPNNSLNVVGDSWIAGNYNMSNTTIPYWTPGPAANVYYRAPNELTATINGSAYTINPATNEVPRLDISGGQLPTYFEGKPLLQVQVYVIPGEIVKSAKAKGIDVNNLNALQQFANSL
jgi:hypothetical protein